MDAARLVMILSVVGFTAAAAFWDYRYKKLPNWLTVPVFAAGLLFHAISGLVTGGLSGMGEGLLLSLGGFGVGFGILLLLWLTGTGGGGDVKYMGALGAWLGPMMTVQVFIGVAVLIAFGGVLVLTRSFFSRGLGATQRKFVSAERKNLTDEQKIERRTRRRLMPLGLSAAIATWLVLLLSELAPLVVPPPATGDAAPATAGQGEFDPSLWDEPLEDGDAGFRRVDSPS